jgi:hypothetical protein
LSIIKKPLKKEAKMEDQKSKYQCSSCGKVSEQPEECCGEEMKKKKEEKQGKEGCGCE